MTDSALSVREASDLAQGLTADNLEAAVAAIDADLVPVYLARLGDGATNIRALVRGLEQRLVADGRTGAHWTIDGVEYGFYGAQQKGWKDVPSLLANLYELGLSPRDVAEAVSELRVTDLRSCCDDIADPRKREAARELIEEHRIDKGERGSPHFQVIESYASAAKK